MEDFSKYKINRAIALLSAGMAEPGTAQLTEDILRSYIMEELEKGKDPVGACLGIIQELYNLNMMTLTVLRRETDKEELEHLALIAKYWMEAGG